MAKKTPDKRNVNSNIIKLKKQLAERINMHKSAATKKRDKSKSQCQKSRSKSDLKKKKSSRGKASRSKSVKKLEKSKSQKKMSRSNSKLIKSKKKKRTKQLVVYPSTSHLKRPEVIHSGENQINLVNSQGFSS